MRYRGRTDANHASIVRELRLAGCSVVSLSNIGDGCPDLLVGKGGRNYLMEIKDPMQKPSEQKLTHAEEAFHTCWLGQVSIVKTIEQALAVVAC